MAATTPTLGLYKPGGGSSGLITPDETVDIDKLNANADLIDAEALSVRNRIAPLEDQDRQYRGPAASLAGISGMRLGDTYQETDGDKKRWKYDGSNWLTAESGLYLIRPTSVVNGTIEADGSVTPTAGASSISLNGVFSSRFRKYRVDYYFSCGGSAGATLRLRNAGEDNSGTNYALQQVASSGSSTTTTGLVNQAQWALAAFSAQFLWGVIEFTNPGHSGTGMEKIVTGLVNGYLNQQLVNFSGLYNTGTGLTFDGFSLNLTLSTFSGPGSRFRVYGMA